ncbi:hypothetical protein SAMN05518672_102607 [Chitinophaga sp. CF118]|uniref:hypothetical protein n=1 Tax=Chitinophaga sp. CF118 TaxID=1884367 RepID=UPI0008E34AAB|nr:hypothetical protein [Chitinophaga sp. CF118]SFD61053.1 hypothetical protein SAMN05518672_102607 [Chitinophaga sp. CF118]
MKFKIVALFSAAVFILSCNVKSVKDDQPTVHLNGTWQLISGTTITKGDTSFTDYTKDQSMIKIINDTHFSFLKHSLTTDSINNFDAGGGSYTLTGNQYIEHLDYYKDKNWEGKAFTFTVTVSNDTLVQQGIEKVEAAGIERVIIEKYVKVK